MIFLFLLTVFSHQQLGSAGRVGFSTASVKR